MLKKMILSLLASSALTAAPQAVVFDWGKVLANPDRQPIVAFLCESLGMSHEEFEIANRQKHETQIPEIEFWMEFAVQQGRALPGDWEERYRTVTKEALNVDAEMYALVDELKAKGFQVALLSNIPQRYADLIRSYGLYDPFQPCLLSGEIGISKPDAKAFELLLQHLSLPASEIVFIDDLGVNIEAARNLGIDAIQFESIRQLKQELTQRGLL